MRIIKIDGQHPLCFESFQEDSIPAYAMLSHTWGRDGEEVNLQYFRSVQKRSTTGWQKIEFCKEQAIKNGIQYFWVDTCCIDKRNSAELIEAITSMFRWYQRAKKCFVYLSDVSSSKRRKHDPSAALRWEEQFEQSRWFRRGWTLQELIAPSTVEFFSQDGRRLGSKRSLEQKIHHVTGIAIEALRGQPLRTFTVQQRFDWAIDRETQREEDQAYCMLGIFDVSMVANYGETKERALGRLREEIEKSINCKDEQPVWYSC